MAEIISNIDPSFEVENEKITALTQKKIVRPPENNFWLTLVLVGYFFLMNMILPVTGDWFNEVMVFPMGWSIFSLFTLANSAVGIYVLKRYAMGFMKRAFVNYRTHRTTNMETLIALGSGSAYLLYLFFIIRYTK